MYSGDFPMCDAAKSPNMSYPHADTSGYRIQDTGYRYRRYSYRIKDRIDHRSCLLPSSWLALLFLLVSIFSFLTKRRINSRMSAAGAIRILERQQPRKQQQSLLGATRRTTRGRFTSWSDRRTITSGARRASESFILLVE
jgi:hypothetical protein